MLRLQLLLGLLLLLELMMLLLLRMWLENQRVGLLLQQLLLLLRQEPALLFELLLLLLLKLKLELMERRSLRLLLLVVLDLLVKLLLLLRLLVWRRQNLGLLLLLGLILRVSHLKEEQILSVVKRVRDDGSVPLLLLGLKGQLRVHVWSPRRVHVSALVERRHEHDLMRAPVVGTLPPPVMRKANSTLPNVSSWLSSEAGAPGWGRAFGKRRMAVAVAWSSCRYTVLVSFCGLARPLGRMSETLDLPVGTPLPFQHWKMADGKLLGSY